MNKETLLHEMLNGFGDKLGYIFMRGMTLDLPEWVEKEAKKDMFFLYTSLSFMFLNGIIKDRNVIRRVLSLLTDFDLDSGKRKAAHEEITDILLMELREKYSFENVEELVTQLNEYDIEQWYYDWEYDLIFKIRDGLFKRGGELYYLTDDNDFVRLLIDGAYTEEDMDSQDTVILLGRGYERILYNDENAGKVYLIAERQGEFYHVFDIESEMISVKKGQLLCVHDGIPYICSENYIGKEENNEIKYLKQIEKNAELELREEGFLVTPETTGGLIFKPYGVTFDGDVIQDKCLSEDFIWKYINDEYSFLSTILSDNNCVRMPEKLTLKSLCSVFKAKKDEYFIVSRYHSLWEVFTIMSHYFDEDMDAVALLYSLCRIDYCISGRVFPSNQFMNMLENISENKDEVALRMSELLKDERYEEFEQLLLSENPESSKSCIEDQWKDGLIGFFEINGDEMLIKAAEKEEGTVIGSLIYPKGDIYAHGGMVYYDCALNQFNIVSDWDISPMALSRIVNKFNLYHFNRTLIRREKREEQPMKYVYDGTFNIGIND